jgi:LmbE family N-acetylglucosaminyl deacetylase
VISLRPDRIGSVIALGAHPDDIEIGAGGLLLRLALVRPDIRVHYVVLTGTPERQAEARAAAESLLPNADLTVALHGLPDTQLPAHWAEAKGFVRDAAATLAPDLVLAPRRDDAHQDHRLLGEFVSQAFRDHIILHYEIPKWDGDIGRPNVYVGIPPAIASQKVELLNTHFVSQKAQDWWDDELFRGLMRIRGMECRSRYAEAFVCEKAKLEL